MVVFFVAGQNTRMNFAERAKSTLSKKSWGRMLQNFPKNLKCVEPYKILIPRKGVLVALRFASGHLSVCCRPVSGEKNHLSRKRELNVHAVKMKRARPAPSMFGGNSSDSEESTPKRRRPLPTFDSDPTNTHKQGWKGDADVNPTGKKEKVEEDSLDMFMNNLASAPFRPTPNRQTPAKHAESESSDDGFVILSETIPGQGESEAKDVEDGDIEDRRDDRPAKDLMLVPVDHASKVYPPLVSCGYEPLPRLGNLKKEERMASLNQLGASVQGGEEVVPVDSFQDLALVLPKLLLGSVLSAFETPTPIQRVAIPAALHGKNIIAVAKTGSGKTAAYTIPLLCHISLQVRGSSTSGKGPSALIIAPTRELALQITGVVKKLGEGMKTGVICVVGGHAKYEQFKRLRDSGAEVVVCTPGRLIDMAKMKACSFARCSFVVLDEADRMFDMGFGPQVDALLSQIRPDAQKVLFSATFPRAVADLAKSYLQEPTRITVGHRNGDSGHSLAGGNLSGGSKPWKVSAKSVPMVSENVTETYVVVDCEAERELWLLSRLDDLIREGLVIVFCQSRGASAALANVIRTTGKPAACVHGETDNADREGLIQMFRSGELPLLITTDLTARGLDIANIKNVINYGCAKSWEWHVHRAGRTGRADQKGSAYTLICRQTGMDMSFVHEAVSAYRKSRLHVPPVLLELEAGARKGKRDSRSRGKGFRGRRRFG